MGLGGGGKTGRRDRRKQGEERKEVRCKKERTSVERK